MFPLLSPQKSPSTFSSQEPLFFVPGEGSIRKAVVRTGTFPVNLTAGLAVTHHHDRPQRFAPAPPTGQDSHWLWGGLEG